MYSPEAFDMYRNEPDKAVCPAGERLTDAQNRMLEAVELIGSRHAGELVAAVTHAVMIRLLVAKLTDVSGEHWRIPVGRGSLTAISIEDGHVSVAGLPQGTDVD